MEWDFSRKYNASPYKESLRTYGVAQSDHQAGIRKLKNISAPPLRSKRFSRQIEFDYIASRTISAKMMAKSDILRQACELLLKKDYSGAVRLLDLVSYFMYISFRYSLLTKPPLETLLGGPSFALSDDDRFAALDQRAAALIQLGDLPSALQDGRRMIKMKKGHPQVLFSDSPLLCARHSSI